MIASAQSRARLDKILGLWNELVDPKVGVIKNVEEGPIDDDDPEFFHYFSKACDTARFTQLSNFSENGGAAISRYVAIAKAMGEAVERYCSAIYRFSDLPFAPYKELRSEAIHPDRLTIYRADQFGKDGFPWVPFTVDTPVHWTRGLSLLTGEEMLIPAAMVYVPYHYHGVSRRAPIIQPISTGLACGTSFEEAAVTGLCEVVERDAFTITWQARLSWPQILQDDLPYFLREIIARFTAVGIEVKLMNITSDIGVPTILSIALSDAQTSPAVAVAAATDASPERALHKCLEELAHTRKYSRQLLLYTPALEFIEGHSNVKDQRDHLRFYCPQESKEFAEFAWASTQTCSLQSLSDLSSYEPQHQLQKLTEKVALAGLEPIACELTTPEIAQLGLHVVRVVIPGAHPLFMGYCNRALGVQRLYEVPQKLGHHGLQRGDTDNPYPHPFP